MIKRRLLLFLAALAVAAAVVLGCYYGLRDRQVLTVGEPFDQNRLEAIEETLAERDPEGGVKVGTITFKTAGLTEIILAVHGYRVRNVVVVKENAGDMAVEVFCLANTRSTRWQKYAQAWPSRKEAPFQISLAFHMPQLSLLPGYDLKSASTVRNDIVTEPEVYFFIRITVSHNQTVTLNNWD